LEVPVANRLVRSFAPNGINYYEMSLEAVAVKAAAGDTHAQNHAVGALDWLVNRNVKKYGFGLQGEEHDDLLQAGRLAVMTAFRKFDVVKGFKFTTYASWWIRRDVQRLANSLRLRRPKSLNAPVGEDTDTTLQDQLADPRSEEGYEAVDSAEDKSASRLALKLLTPKEAKVMELRFGIEQVPAPDDDVMARIRAIEAKARRRVKAA
jgi:RNA polymerase sigma factor (sigma-70 family)